MQCKGEIWPFKSVFLIKLLQSHRQEVNLLASVADRDYGKGR